MSVKFKGPIFDGRANLALKQYVDKAEEVLAEEGKELVHARLRAVLRHPTGYYQSRVAIDHTTTGRVVHDNKVIYGRWLEGVNEQNRTTRFKGYHTFEIASHHLRLRAKPIAESVLARYIGRMR